MADRPRSVLVSNVLKKSLTRTSSQYSKGAPPSNKALQPTRAQASELNPGSVGAGG
jgi:hypothetical protein